MKNFYLHLRLHLRLRFSAGLVIRRARKVIICQFKKHFHRALIIHCKILYVKRLTWNFLEIFYFSFQPSRFDQFFGQKRENREERSWTASKKVHRNFLCFRKRCNDSRFKVEKSEWFFLGAAIMEAEKPRSREAEKPRSRGGGRRGRRGVKQSDAAERGRRGERKTMEAES